MAHRRTAWIFAFAIIALTLAAHSAGATILSLTVPVAGCQFAGGPTGPCYDTGFLDDQAVGATDSFIGDFPHAHSDAFDFTDAFNNWNAANGSQWQLVNGGALPISLGVNVVVSAGTFGGGINPIIVGINSYTAGPGIPSLSQLVWTQALVSNYTATSTQTLSPPIVTLDTYSLSQGSFGSGGAFQTPCEPIPGQSPGPNNTVAASIGATSSGQAYCDPIYPFQYGQSTGVGPDPFADGPEGAWPDDSFRGIALLSTVTFDTNGNGDITNRILTVYQGIDYGFNLSAPEPGSLLLFAPAAAALAFGRRRLFSRQ